MSGYNIRRTHGFLLVIPLPKLSGGQPRRGEGRGAARGVRGSDRPNGEVYPSPPAPLPQRGEGRKNRRGRPGTGPDARRLTAPAKIYRGTVRRPSAVTPLRPLEEPDRVPVRVAEAREAVALGAVLDVRPRHPEPGQLRGQVGDLEVQSDPARPGRPGLERQPAAVHPLPLEEGEPVRPVEEYHPQAEPVAVPGERRGEV